MHFNGATQFPLPSQVASSVAVVDMHLPLSHLNPSKQSSFSAQPPLLPCFKLQVPEAPLTSKHYLHDAIPRVKSHFPFGVKSKNCFSPLVFLQFIDIVSSHL